MAEKPEFHEDYGREDAVRMGSDRGFGMTMAAACLVFAGVGFFRRGELSTVAASLLVGAAIFLALALSRPAWLRPLNRLWLGFGVLLNRVVSPLVLGLLFYATVTPTGFIMRLLGKDPLRLQRDEQAVSYWIERTPPGPPPESMARQF